MISRFMVLAQKNKDKKEGKIKFGMVIAPY